ncbi:MAG TPA: tetratricopeptide repeat protein [Pseudolabrys sp.]|nr:tetratricopeptide repeat protein [Pseudolabrys sp.]
MPPSLFPLPLPNSAPKAAPLNVPQVLAQALALHEKGRLNEAERLYTDILAVRPDHFDALQMLGVIKLAKGQPAEALRLVSQAMNARKPSPQILLNYGMVLHALKRSDEAIESFDHAIKLKSKFAEAHNNRGAVLSSLGRHELAVESCRKALALKSDYADAHYNLGTALRALGYYEEAIKSLDRALALRPDDAKANNNRGAALESLTRYQEALACYDRALALDPRFGEARNNRGRVLALLDRADEALANFELAIRQNPNDAEAHYNLGKVFIDLNRNDEAAACFARALALKPDYPEARFADCFAELPVIYADEGEIARRRAAYEGKLRILAADIEAGRLKGDLVKAVAAKHPFLLAYQGGNDRPLQDIYGGMISRIMAQAYTTPDMPPAPAPGEPIRVGIVSAFFYLHSNWKIPIKGWLGQIDRARFKIFGYHLGTRRDSETDVAAAMCDRFVHRVHDVDGWRREILSDAPHVLIYPGLLMDNFSLQLAAQRLAPVQLNSWGHPETSGLPALDYFLSSDLMEAPEADSHYTEKLVRLPNLSFYYEPVAAEPVAVTRAEFGLREDATVFWSAQSLYKYLPQYDYAFAEIARRAGNCQFVFLRHYGGPRITELMQERLERAFAAVGLKAADYCVFLPRLSQGKFIAAAGLSDLFLDSLGWSGCNSAIESLEHNTPIVTWPGPMMRGRHSAAILRMMDVTETIAGSVADYIEIAARLAGDRDARQALRARIAGNKHRLYRDRACVTALEDLLEGAVRQPSA